MKNLENFIEDYVDGEPLTSESVKWAIKKYIYMNYNPTKQDKLEMYEKLLISLANATEEEAAKLLTNIKNWNHVRTNPNKDFNEQNAIENETFYNLTKIIH